MRRRLLWSTLAAVGLAVVLLGLPLMFAVRNLLVSEAVAGTRLQAEQTAVFFESQAGSPLFSAQLIDDVAASIGARVTLLDGEGRVIYDSGGAQAGALLGIDRDVVSVGSYASRVTSDTVAVAVRADLEGSPVIVRVARNAAALSERIRQAWLAIGALGITALSAAALLALWQGRRFAAPLEDLAGSARRLGEGDFSARAPRSGLPEADQVAGALDATAARLAGMLERSRSFSADASHQLRTPLTALRLDLEAVEAVADEPAVRAELLAAAMAETDRLETTIDELLTLAEAPRGDEFVDLATTAEQRLDAWRSLARAQGRDVALDIQDVPPVRARPAAIGQALQVLLDNALEHGAGTVTVAVRRLAVEGPRGRPWVRLCVGDEGAGFDPAVMSAGHSRPGGGGRGLPLARSLVEAEGGRLVVERGAQGVLVCLLLPLGVDKGRPADAETRTVGG